MINTDAITLRKKTDKTLLNAIALCAFRFLWLKTPRKQAFG